jgi:heptosyltransferase-1
VPASRAGSTTKAASERPFFMGLHVRLQSRAAPLATTTIRMTTVLLVKTSSLGDVVHNLPVVADIRAALPGAAIDWMVEENFAAIPRLHPGLRAVIPVSVRRWRGAWWRRGTRSEIAALRARLQDRPYDAVLDTQGLLKSALLARAARGPRHGLDWASAREPLSWLYDRTYSVSWAQHAVERNRELAARALGYVKPGHVDSGIAAARDPGPGMEYAVLLHATSARSKLWPEAAWVALAGRLAALGMRAVLPWGNAEERARSARLSAAMPGSRVPEALSLDEAAKLLAGARLVVGVDTGLTHLAGALGVPTLGIYTATDPAATGLYGCARALNVGGMHRVPAVSEVVTAIGSLLAP